MRKAFVEIKTAKKRAEGCDVANGEDREGRKRKEKEVHASYHGST